MQTACTAHRADSMQLMYILFHMLHCRNHRRNNTAAEVKAARDLEMASKGCSGNIPLPHGNDEVYDNPDIPLRPNPCYGRVK